MKMETVPSLPRKFVVERPPRDEFTKAWFDSSLRRIDIAAKFGLSKTLCRNIAMEFGLPAIREQCENGYNNRQDDPTPEEILQRAAEVRRRWSDAERSRRMNVKFKSAIC